MGLRDLFVVAQKEAEKGMPVGASASRQGVGVFITPKSLLAFPTASFVVTMLANFVKHVVPGVAGSIWVPVGSAFLIGTVVFVATIISPNLKLKGFKSWFVTVAVGFVNCIYLASTALGLLTVTK